MDDKGKPLGSLGLDDIAPAAESKGPGLDSADFSPRSNGGPTAGATDESPAPAPTKPVKFNKTPPLGLLAMLMAAGALVISLWALWSTPEAVMITEGSGAQSIQVQLDNLSNRISEFEVSPLGPPDKKSHTAAISLLRRKVVSMAAKIDGIEQEQRRLAKAVNDGGPMAVKTPVARPTRSIAQTATPQPTPTKVMTPAPTPTQAAKSTTKKIVHTVRSGQTLSLLSRRYNVTITAIKRWNGLRSNNIKVGQKLVIYVKR